MRSRRTADRRNPPDGLRARGRGDERVLFPVSMERVLAIPVSRLESLFLDELTTLPAQTLSFPVARRRACHRALWGAGGRPPRVGPA
ncbi:hypothetical protein Raf01_59390 [Rugosimonospora africana]|uniref:Uncharacterized protein n=1 Tax=Rugosimonospora africana TaxID=556532 RepID=A0A8J3QX73_9ACTN|nr:hypothetical protein Raf01_59390 [Rugosimonospora africana]